MFKVNVATFFKCSLANNGIFQHKMIPAHWSETMTTEVGDGKKICTATLEMPVEDPGYHYISLVPQQIAAGLVEA